MVPERVGISEATLIAGIPKRTLQAFAEAGGIPGAGKPKGRWTFDVNELRRWARAKAVPVTNARTVYSFIRGNVTAGSEIHTDEAAAYRPLNGLYYSLHTVNHGLGAYSRDIGNGEYCTTNGVESVFAVLKRGLIGTYHHVSAKHLNRYVGEFAFRLNDGDVSRHTMQRLASLFSAAIGRRLTYKELIA